MKKQATEPRTSGALKGAPDDSASRNPRATHCTGVKVSPVQRSNNSTGWRQGFHRKLWSDNRGKDWKKLYSHTIITVHPLKYPFSLRGLLFGKTCKKSSKPFSFILLLGNSNTHTKARGPPPARAKGGRTLYSFLSKWHSRWEGRQPGHCRD